MRRHFVSLAGVLALGAGLLLPASAGGALAAGTLAGGWTFDEGGGATAADSSGAGHPATLQGGATWGAARIGPSALSLNGAAGSAADVAAPVVDTSQSFTAAAWVLLNDTNTWHTALSIDGTNVSGFYLQYCADCGTFALTVQSSDSTSSSATRAAAAIGAPVPGTWYHLAGVFDAAAHTVTLYVNGVLQSTLSFTSPWRASGHTAIGRARWAGAPVDWFPGRIDDARLYQGALTAAEVQALPGVPASSGGGPATLAIDAGRTGVHVSPTLYGLMFEEINHSGDGGLYAELVQNRDLKDSTTSPVHWTAVTGGGSAGSVALDTSRPVPGTALTSSLRLQAANVPPGQRVGAANDGFWGIPVRQGAIYHASFFAEASLGAALTVSLESADGGRVFARGTAGVVGTGWSKFSVDLTADNVPVASSANRLVISTGAPGTVWLTQVSLMPATFDDRPNGMRPDLMQKLADMKPAFLRFPGGNYLEGNTIATRFQWKNTLGDVSQRPGHQDDAWGYRSSDGLGLLEYLQWTEDLGISPVLGVYDGYSLNGGRDRSQIVPVGAQLEPFVQDALDEIQYATGDTSTTWGARRAADGHPAPFPVQYVEIGNEDFFDPTRSYDARFTQFATAIRAQSPALQLIATTAGVRGAPVDVVDDHHYQDPTWFLGHTTFYDTLSRSGPKLFVGEYASLASSVGQGNLWGALGEAAWMTGLERNSDQVIMASYAPLFVNVNNRAWNPDLIGYDSLTSYGTPSYYVQKLFSTNHGDVTLPATLSGVTMGNLAFVVSRDTATGTAFVKFVNANATALTTTVTLSGVTSVGASGTATVLTSGSVNDENSVASPTRVVPVTSPLNGLGTSFTYTFPANSVTVLQLTAR